MLASALVIAIAIGALAAALDRAAKRLENAVKGGSEALFGAFATPQTEFVPLDDLIARKALAEEDEWLTGELVYDDSSSSPATF